MNFAPRAQPSPPPRGGESRPNDLRRWPTDSVDRAPEGGDDDDDNDIREKSERSGDYLPMLRWTRRPLTCARVATGGDVLYRCHGRSRCCHDDRHPIPDRAEYARDDGATVIIKCFDAKTRRHCLRSCTLPKPIAARRPRWHFEPVSGSSRQLRTPAPRYAP